jgi:hypothetical protein
MESVEQSKTGMVRGSGKISSLMNYLHAFVNIVDDFQKVIPCACAIKIPIISQFPSPTGLTQRKALLPSNLNGLHREIS